MVSDGVPCFFLFEGDLLIQVSSDALPSIGHACGHNLIAMASISAALATKSVMQAHKLAGKVILYGTPAEEGLSKQTRLSGTD